MRNILIFLMINFFIENDIQYKENQIEKLTNDLQEIRKISKSKMNDIKSMPISEQVLFYLKFYCLCIYFFSNYIVITSSSIKILKPHLSYLKILILIIYI